MARKYHEIKGLAEFTAKMITSDEEQWKKFLHTAGHMYKYPFREQMLIYAQRPDATACASLELWNEKMNCWVNKGAQGIALIDEEGVHRSGLKYVFDVKDVHEARFIGHKPNLWKMEDEHKEAVLDALERTYGETDSRYSFESRIVELSNRIAAEMAPDIVSEQLSMSVEGSFLEELDELNLQVRLQETLAASIAYTVLERCGMDTEDNMIDNVLNNLPQDPEEKKEPAPQREMREAEVKKVRKRVSMKALLPLKKAEVAEREKKTPEVNAPSKRPSMGVDD